MSRADADNPDPIAAAGGGRGAAAPSRAARLRALLESPVTAFLMEAHNGISARVVEEAGFAGIWASSLAMSAQFGLRDSNEASWTQVLDLVEHMADATTVPILLDGDTGYGSFNNVRRLVRKLEQRGVAGVCLEDKLFPKTNSFVVGTPQPLADVDEFCGKIKAARDTSADPHFCLVARVEALIAGWGMREALRRAEAYRLAGADAILIHSKQPDAGEILAFAEAWAGRLPVIIVPTTYFATPTDIFRSAGVSVVVWANHMLRAAVRSMQSVAREVFERQSLVPIEATIAPLDEIFRLQNVDELQQAERRYTPSGRARLGAIVLPPAGGAGASLIDDPAGGLENLIDDLHRLDVHTVTIVSERPRTDLAHSGAELIVDPGLVGRGDLAALARAASNADHDLVILSGDLRVRPYVLRDLLDGDAAITVVVDSDPTGTIRGGGSPAYAWCTEPDDRSLIPRDVRLRHVAAARPVDRGEPHGRWIGLLAARGPARVRLLEAVERLRRHEEFDALNLPRLLNDLIRDDVPVQVLYIHGHWREAGAPSDGNVGSRGEGAEAGGREEHDDQRGGVRRTGTGARV